MGEVLYPLGLTSDERAALRIPDYSSSRYRTDCSLAEVRAYLKNVKACIRHDEFVVLEGDPDDPLNTRCKNSEFLFAYGLADRQRQKQLLLSVSEDEFCHVVICNDGRELYVFCLDRSLYKAASGCERVRMYLKHDYDGKSFDVVVSLHGLELPIVRAFGD